MALFGKSKRRTPAGPAYDFRLFLTSDARQNAFDDDMVITTSQSGLAGLMPLYQVIAAQLPNGFDYMTSLIGYGGNNSPVAMQVPLIDETDLTGQFLAAQSPYLSP